VALTEKMYGEMAYLVLLHIINREGLPNNEELYKIGEALQGDGYSPREVLSFLEYLSAKSTPPIPEAPTVPASVDAVP